jgi:hypothetical protein
MSSDRDLRPGIALIVGGAVVIGLSVGRCVTGWVTGPSRVVFEATNWAIGLTLASVGWWRLRRAKASLLGLSWRAFLGTDLLALGVVAAFGMAVAGMTDEQRESLVNSLREFIDAVNVARGGP